MHEASKNPDRSNEQNVAICMQAWRDAKKEGKADSKCMNTFKTLAEARTAYDALARDYADLDQKTAKISDLEAELAESKASLASVGTENESFRTMISLKDSEISSLNGEIAALRTDNLGLKTQVETLEKSQKTAKIQARELVAASGGTPIAVDQGEIARMQAGSEKEFLADMLKEQNPDRLNQLYNQYNKLFRSNGKKKN